MRQVIPVHIWGDLSDGGGTAAIVGIWPNGQTPQLVGREDIVHICCPLAGTFQNMVVEGDTDGTIWTLYVNDVASALTATTSSGIALDSTHTVTVALGDRVYYHRQGSLRIETDHVPLHACIEIETAASTISMYGFSAEGASSAAGGTLGSSGLSGINPSFTFSVVPIAGTITRNMIFAWFHTTDATKGYRATIYKNKVAQDGSGGTPDTRVTLLASSPGFQSTSVVTALTVVVGDILDTQIDDVNSIGGSSKAGNSVEFTATTAGQFAICGSNATASGGGGPYAALTVYGSVPGRWGLTEASNGGAHNIGAVTSFALTGLQWAYDPTYPAGTGPVTFKLYKNSTDPANQPTITITTNDTYVADTDPSHVVQIDYGDTWSTVAVATNTGNVQAHWSFAATTTTLPDDDTPRSPQRGIYVPTRGVGGAEGGGSGADFNSLDSRIIPVPIRNRGIYVPTRAVGGAEGGSAPFDYLQTRTVFVQPVKRTLYVEPTPRTAVVYDGEGYSHR